jgi:hypothetical protein
MKTTQYRVAAVIYVMFTEQSLLTEDQAKWCMNRIFLILYPKSKTKALSENIEFTKAKEIFTKARQGNKLEDGRVSQTFVAAWRVVRQALEQLDGPSQSTSDRPATPSDASQAHEVNSTQCEVNTAQCEGNTAQCEVNTTTSLFARLFHCLLETCEELTAQESAVPTVQKLFTHLFRCLLKSCDQLTGVSGTSVSTAQASAATSVQPHDNNYTC